MKKQSFIYLVVCLCCLSTILTACEDKTKKIQVETLPILSIEGFSDAPKTLRVGEALDLKVAVSDNSQQDFRFEITPHCFARVDANARLRANRVGAAMLIVTAKDNEKITRTYKLDIREAQTLQIDGINDGKLILDEGQEFDLNVRFVGGEPQDYEYMSSSDDFITIDKNGKIKALAVGTARVSVKAKNDPMLTTGFDVVVRELPGILVDNLRDNKTKLVLGAIFNIVVKSSVETPFEYEYETDKEGVVSVNEQGEVFAIGVGKTTVTVKAKQNRNIKTSFEIEVEQISIFVQNVTEEPLVMVVNDEFEIKVLASNSEIYNYLYSADSNIVEIIDGKIKAKSLGETTITVKLGHDETIATSFKLKVIGKPQWYNRTDWVASAPYYANPSAKEKNIGYPRFLIDNDKASCLSMPKPGKKYPNSEYGDASAAKDGDVFFLIDTKKLTKFSLFKLRHRTSPSVPHLRIHELKILGSNDGVNFTEIKSAVKIKHDEKTDEVMVDLGAEYEFRHIKVVPTLFSKDRGMTLQVADFNLAYRE